MRAPSLLLTATWLLAASALAAQSGLASDSLAGRLAQLIDIPDPAERRRAAAELAKDPKLDVATLRGAMRSFGDFSPQQPGRMEKEVALWVGDKTEATELHIFVPKNYDPRQPTPLLVIGHWTGGSGDRAVPTWIRFAEQTGTLLLAASEAAANDGWAFSVRERESALSAIRYMKRHFNVDENRIMCTGVSRGGHMVWDLALRYPDLFAAIAPMIGGPRIKRVQGQNNLRYIENIIHLPIRDLQGSKDDPYLVANLRLGFERLKELKAVDARLIEFPKLGHSYDINAVDWSKFFGDARRDPVPRRVIRMVATSRETRAFWVDVLKTDKKRVQEIPQIAATRSYDSLDEMGKREFVARRIEKRTGRLEVEYQGKGKFFAKGRHVTSFRILLEPEMFDPKKPVLVRYKARQHRLRTAPSKAVLCREFADRFDRTFLPVAEVTVR